jgi:sugar-specific transcriptional regulator TrmB
MPIAQEDIQILTELGLTGSQAKVYLALAQQETASARRLWKASKVSRQDIYRLLTDLREIGLIEKILNTPTEFKAVPIEDGISILIERRAKEVLNMRKKAEKVIQKFKENNLKMTDEEADAQYMLVPKKEALTRKLKKTIKATRKSINVISSMKVFLNALYVFAEEYKEALGRGIKVRWIIDRHEDINSWPESIQALTKNPNFKIRTIPDCPHVRLGTYDKKRVFLALFPNSHPFETPALWSTNISFAGMVQSFFETIWNRATKYEPEEQNLN